MKKEIAAYWEAFPALQPQQDCILWPFSKDGPGYGQAYVEGRKTGAHRVAYEIVFGPFDEELWVLHHCDNRACVNPKHLFLGTQKDNMHDCSVKGRIVAQAQKLSSAEAHKIYLLYWSFGMQTTMIARHYQVSRPTVSDLVHGRTWRSLSKSLPM